ncbi:MAG: hypothetical protein PF569_07945 [Candidatus Woesearchaeota archaeon]|jgi:hypothetical protein|nr:hypothetical protein [Candidatus Woesearchaeota archaeon]
MHKDKHRLNLKFILILGSIILLIGLFSVMFNPNHNSYNSQIKEPTAENEVLNQPIKENIVENEEILAPNNQNNKKYLGDIHFMIGLGEEDKLVISINKKEVFNSNSNEENGVFQKQIFDSTYVGENNIDITYEDKNDGQPLVLFIIKDGSETIYNWEPTDSQGLENFKLNIE